MFLPVRKLIQNAVIHRFVVEYKCTECGMRFPVPLHKHVTGGTFGPPTEVKNAFESHACKVDKKRPKAVAAI